MSSSTFSIFLGQNCSYDHTSHCQISPHHTTAHLHQLQYYQVSLWHLQTKFYLLSHEWWRLPPKYFVFRRVLSVNCWCKSWWHVCQVLFCFLIVIATLAVKRRVVVWGEYTIILTYTPHSLITHHQLWSLLHLPANNSRNTWELWETAFLSQTGNAGILKEFLFSLDMHQMIGLQFIYS